MAEKIGRHGLARRRALGHIHPVSAHGTGRAAWKRIIPMSDTPGERPYTVGDLIAELQKLDASRPVAIGVLVSGDEGAGEVDVYGIDMVEEMEGEDGQSAYVICCDLRGEEDEEEEEA